MSFSSSSENILSSLNNELEGGNMKVHGLNVVTAAVFIVGEMSGTGVLSLPQAINQSGWFGVALVLGCCVLSAYCGIRLSSCWKLILRENQDLSQSVRDPFPTIAYEAAGIWARRLLSVITYIQLIGVAVIFLLLASENIASLLSDFVLHTCEYTLIISAIMCPISMLGTPKDFWPIAVGAMVFTGIACLLIFVQTMRQIPAALPAGDTVTFNSFFTAFGTILFCFGGAVMFPTIQTDMIKPQKFHQSVIISYSVMLAFYLPVGIGCYLIYGKSLKDNVIENLNDNWLKKATIVLITGHLLTAFNIILNPVFQMTEHLFRTPEAFSLKRFLVRSGILLLVLFIAQSVPNFGPILSFIGGSTVSLSSFILPCVFYVLLCRKDKYATRISKIEFVFLFVVILIGALGGIASTYSSLSALFKPSTFKKPCYLNITQ